MQIVTNRVISFDFSQYKHPQLASFSLHLNSGHVFECHEIVRCVPNKRLVCKGVWDGQSVYVKLFIGKQAKRYAARDLRGVQLLQQAAIATPALLQASELLNTDTSCEALVFSAVDRGQNAEELYQKTDVEQRYHLAEMLVKAVAEHHQSGLIQHDLYLKNFLIASLSSGQQVYTLDGDGIRSMWPFFRRCQAQRNLAVLLSKFESLEMLAWLPELLTLYAKERGFSSVSSVSKMQALISQHRCKVVATYADKKVFRQCTDVDYQRTQRWLSAVSRNDVQFNFSNFMNEPDAFFDSKESKRLKNGRTCTVSLVTMADEKLVFKRYNIKSRWYGFLGAFRKSRAANSWANAHRLLMYQIPTAKPVAFIEERVSLLSKRAYFVTSYIDAPDVKAYFADDNINNQSKKQVAENLARLFFKLRHLSVAHGDCKASNIKVLNQQVVLIDLDSLHEYRLKCWFNAKHVRDLRRLMQNWQQDVAMQQLIISAFEKVYQDHQVLQKAWGSLMK